MKRFFNGKKKVLLVLMLFLAVTLTGCKAPRGQNGKTYVNSIYSIKDETVKRSEVDIPEELEEQYKDYGPDDEIVIEKTTFRDALDEGWFHGIIVYPISYMINFIAGYTDAGIGVIATTIIIQMVIFLLSLKSQVASQKMQEIQPEVAKIQAKYAGKTDDRSRMLMAQEQQALYSKYKINPFGTMLVTFIQFPVIFGMYYATMRAYAVVCGSFLGINLAYTPLEGLQMKNIWYIIIFVLMIGAQLLSFKVPQWLQKYRKKKSKVKEKKYAQQNNQSGMSNTMNMTMYMSTAMIAVFAISWPLSMSFYWLVNSIVRICQNLVVHKFFIKD